MTHRSYLFVPGDRPERFDKAVAAGADVTVLDLEDAVKPDQKEVARAAIRGWLSAGGRAALRVNGIGTEWHDEDAKLLALPGVTLAMLPKAEDAAALARFVAGLRPGLPVTPLIETAQGIFEARALARVKNVRQLAFGSVDFQLDAGIEGEDEELLFARSQLVLASAAAGIAAPVDGVTVALDDAERLTAETRRARRLGFGGKLCIHPRQVATVHRAFAPDDAEIARARAIVAAADDAEAGAIRLDGKLIDRPVVERARRVLETLAP